MNPTLELAKAWFAYQQFVMRLQWRGKLSRAFARVMAVRGQMRRSEVRCLWDLAQQAPPNGVIVEIGSFRGLSTAALASGSLRGPGLVVYAIDPHEYRDPRGWIYSQDDHVAFMQYMLFAGVAHMVRSINLLSWEVVPAWDKPISLLWVDGNHDYEAVKRDFQEWARFVLPNGIIALHDASDPNMGPTRVVEEARASGQWKLVTQVEKIAVLRRG